MVAAGMMAKTALTHGAMRANRIVMNAQVLGLVIMEEAAVEVVGMVSHAVRINLHSTTKQICQSTSTTSPTEVNLLRSHSRMALSALIRHYVSIFKRTRLCAFTFLIGVCPRALKKVSAQMVE